MLNVVSMFTCWSDDSCESKCSSFLQGERREVVDLPSCMDCVYEFTPRFAPFVPESFTFSLVKIVGTEEEITPITDFRYSTLDCKFRVNTGLPSCKCICNPCGCAPEYKLLVEYVAGYEELPACVLPVLCNLLTVIHAKNDCCCDDSCACNQGEQDIKYACGDVTSVQIETDLGKLVAEQMTGSLGVLSVCPQQTDIWGVVV